MIFCFIWKGKERRRLSKLCWNEGLNVYYSESKSQSVIGRGAAGSYTTQMQRHDVKTEQRAAMTTFDRNLIHNGSSSGKGCITRGGTSERVADDATTTEVQLPAMHTPINLGHRRPTGRHRR